MNRCKAASLLAAGMMLAAPGADAAGSEPAAPLASTFAGPLWSVIAPAGGTASVANGHLILSVPGGANHDPYRPSNQSLRVVQPIGNYDFDVSIEIDSTIAPTARGTSQGLMVLANNQNFVTFAFETDGSKISLKVQTVTAGVAKTIWNTANFSEYHNPICLRLKRQGFSYLAYYSVDGVVWTQATTFNYTLVPSLVGPFAGNYSANPASAVPITMAINWFHVL
jgi:hypothetical protein